MSYLEIRTGPDKNGFTFLTRIRSFPVTLEARDDFYLEHVYKVTAHKVGVVSLQRLGQTGGRMCYGEDVNSDRIARTVLRYVQSRL